MNPVLPQQTLYPNNLYTNPLTLWNNAYLQLYLMYLPIYLPSFLLKFFCLFPLQLITVKIGTLNNSMPSSPDSSSDSSGGSTPAALDGPNLEAENCLPGAVRVVKIIYYTQ